MLLVRQRRFRGLQPWALLLLLLAGSLAGCLGTSDSEAVVTKTKPLRGSRIDLVQDPLLDEVAVLEDGRTTGGGRLLELARHERAPIRAAAVRALGRLPFPQVDEGVTAALGSALQDQDASVRSAAAFALGMRGDPAAGALLFALRSDPDPDLRAAVVDALTKLDVPDLHVGLLGALQDPDLDVRSAAILGTARWKASAERAALVDRALLGVLQPDHQNRRRPNAFTVNPELGWRALYALARRGSRVAREAFLEGLDSSRPLERLFAARGLAHQEPDAEIVRALGEALAAELDSETGDWRIAVEAIQALEALKLPAAQPMLVEALGARSFHVRAAAARALGVLDDPPKSVPPALARALRDLSPTVRASALEAFARLAPRSEAWGAIRRAASSEDPVVRLGAVRAAGALEGEASLAFLLESLHDQDPLVAAAAVPLLAERGPLTRDVLRRLLAHEDNGMRLAAVMALEEDPTEEDVEALARAYESSSGDVATEVAFHALLALGKVGSPRAQEVTRSALADPRPFVRQIAVETLRRDFGSTAHVPPGLRRSVRPDLQLPDYAFNPIVEVRTTKGTLVFELFPAEAPLHVHNFLLLANRGHYDGLRFHRVVSDFVVQGGDYRGDGNGAAPALGIELAHEIGRRRYVRGSLGMPRYEDLDSGGSQFFVTHRPTPHLDGRYTIFGELRSGGNALDALEVGDRILAVDLVREDA